MCVWLVLVFWTNSCLVQGNPACNDQSWRDALSKPGWANCSGNTYLSGLVRDVPIERDGIDRITAARCCQPPLQFLNDTFVCTVVDWSATVNSFNTWATCPEGFFLQGIYRSNDTWIHNIEKAKCCRPSGAKETYNFCYEENVLLSLDSAGPSQCLDGYVMIGIYKGGCDLLHCIEHFRCCEIRRGRGILGNWFLNGQDPDISFSSFPVAFTNGRCPDSKAFKFDRSHPFAYAPILNIRGRTFAITCWIKVDFSGGTIGTIYSDWRHPFQFYFGVRNQNLIFGRHGEGEEKWMSLESQGSLVPLSTWVHVGVNWLKNKEVGLYINGHKVAKRPITVDNFYGPTGNWYQIGSDSQGKQFYGAVMELYVFGSELTEIRLHRLLGFPVVTVRVKGTTAEVSWEAPFKGACPVTMYTVYHREVSSSVMSGLWSSTNVSKNTASLLLKCLTTYEIAVTAWSSNGETPLNRTTPLTVGTKGGSPSSPVIENKEIDISSCDFNLTWSVTQDESCPLTMYTVYYHATVSNVKNAADQELNITNVTETSHVFALECDKQYQFGITAWNRVGQSKKSRRWLVKTNSGLVKPSKAAQSTVASSAVSSLLTDGQFAGLITGVVAVVIVLALVVFRYLKWWKKNRTASKLKTRRSPSDIVVLQQWETPPEHVVFKEELGRGAFGIVFKGLLKESPGIEVFYRTKEETIRFKEVQTVAIKVLAATASEETKGLFLEEIELMKRVGSHKNVLSMVGFWVKSAPIFLLLEYVPYGDLLQWLRSKRFEHSGQKRPVTDTDRNCEEVEFNIGEPKLTMKSPLIKTLASSTNQEQNLTERMSNLYEEDPTVVEVDSPRSVGFHDNCEPNDDFTAKDLLSFAWQIARGMRFLASGGFVHRDLAARNVLLGEGKVIKIADFGLMRHVYGEVYEMKKHRKLPIKWMAPEALYSSIYTSKSDVWSFGVVLWELSTMGGIPYPGIENRQLYKLLKTGHRLDKPDTCSDELFQVMSDCWKEEPDQRPTFEQLTKTLEEMMTHDTPYLDLNTIDESKACYAERMADSDVSEEIVTIL